MVNWLLMESATLRAAGVIPALLAEPHSRLAGFVSRDPRKAEPWGPAVLDQSGSSVGGGALRRGVCRDSACLALSADASRAARGLSRALRKAFRNELRRSAADGGGGTPAEPHAGRGILPAVLPQIIEGERVARQWSDRAPVAGGTDSPRLTCAGEASAHPWLFDPAVAGGGPLYDVGSHRIDVLNFLFGRPCRVNGLLSPAGASGGVEASAIILAEYENGVRGVVECLLAEQERRDECRILGSSGELNLTPLNGPKLAWPAARKSCLCMQTLICPASRASSLPSNREWNQSPVARLRPGPTG